MGRFDKEELVFNLSKSLLHKKELHIQILFLTN